MAFLGIAALSFPGRGTKLARGFFFQKVRDNPWWHGRMETHPSTSLLSRYSITFLGVAALLFSGTGLLLSGCQAPVIIQRGPLSVSSELWLDWPGSPANYLERQFAARKFPLAPREEDRQLFATYDVDRQVTWSTGWAATLDLSGVAWDSPRAGTLIHPRYVVFASHFPRRVDEELTFHDREGRPLVRKIVAKRKIHRIRTPDLSVARLDRPVPDTVATYPLFGLGTHSPHTLVGAPLIVTDQERRAHVFRINQVTRRQGFVIVVARPPLGRELGAAWQERLQRGDSGHPAFTLLGGRLVLVSTLKGGGWTCQGPFMGDGRLQNAVAGAILAMEREFGGEVSAAAEEKHDRRRHFPEEIPISLVGRPFSA